MDYVLQKHKNIIIMPFYLDSVVIYHALSAKGINVLGFWDNNEALNGKTYNGMSITLPNSAEAMNIMIQVIVCNERHEDAINRQLIDLGYTDIIPAKTLGLSGLREYYNHLNDRDLPQIDQKYERLLYLDSKVYPLNTVNLPNIGGIIKEVSKHRK